jgi:hypothetical protein
MSATTIAAATHRPSLFAALLAAVMQAFDALHDAQWRAPWARHAS